MFQTQSSSLGLCKSHNWRKPKIAVATKDHTIHIADRLPTNRRTQLIPIAPSGIQKKQRQLKID